MAIKRICRGSLEVGSSSQQGSRTWGGVGGGGGGGVALLQKKTYELRAKLEVGRGEQGEPAPEKAPD